MKNHEVTPLEVPQVICATTSKAAAQPRPSANFKKTRSEGPHPSRMAVAHGAFGHAWWSRMRLGRLPRMLRYSSRMVLQDEARRVKI